MFQGTACGVIDENPLVYDVSTSEFPKAANCWSCHVAQYHKKNMN